MPESRKAVRLWRGYVAHALFFYRQNARPSLSALPGLGDAVPFGTGAHPPLPQATAGLLLRGLSRPERYWGSLRLGDQALRLFERAALSRPEDPWALLLAGMTHEMQRRYVRAIACFDRAAELAPQWPWPLILRGICRWYLAEFRESVRDFERALEADPGCVPALLFLSRAKSDTRERSLVADLDRADRLAPGDPFVLSWRGRAKFVVDRTPESLDDLRRSARLLPRYDRSWSWLGISLMELGRVKEALPLLKRADKLNPFYPTTIYPLARALMELGRWDDAGRALRRAAAVDRSGIWVEHRISMSHPNPAARRSIADLDRFLAARPRAAWALAWRGQTRLLVRDYRQALADLDGALALAPRDPWTRLWKGETLRRLGYAKKALAEFDAALKADTSLSWAWAGRGWCLLSLGKTAAGKKSLERSLKLQPGCAEALAWAGDTQAARTLRPQLGMRPEASGDAAAAFSRPVLEAWCREKESPGCAAAFRAGDLARALRLAAPPGHPGEIRAFLFRGWLKLQCGDAAGALEEAGRALDEGFDPSGAPALWLRQRALRALGEVPA